MDKLNKIILTPDEHFNSMPHVRMSAHARCLLSLNSRLDVTVSEGVFSFPYRARGECSISAENGKCGCFFSVNGSTFMLLDTDSPQLNMRHWIKYYAEHVKAFFICAYYKEMKPIFEELGIKAFPCFGAYNRDFLELNNDEETQKMTDRSIEKNISIFFQGKFRCNPKLRPVLAKMIKERFHDSHIEDTVENGISSKVYLNLLQRSKIVWGAPGCDVTIDNVIRHPLQIRAREAMCVESLVVSHPIDVFATEELIPGEHFVETKRDHSDLIETLEKYLSDDEERLRIARNGRLYFERNCTTRARATYLLEKCLSVI